MFKPLRPALVVILVWEVFLGLLYPISGLPVNEHPQVYLIIRTLERFGDYAAPVALFVLMTYRPKRQQTKMGPEGLNQPAAVAGD